MNKLLYAIHKTEGILGHVGISVSRALKYNAGINEKRAFSFLSEMNIEQIFSRKCHF